MTMKKLRVLLASAMVLTFSFSVTAIAAYNTFADGRASGTLNCYYSGQLRSHSASTSSDGYNVKLKVTGTYSNGSEDIYETERVPNYVSTSSGYDWVEDFASLHQAFRGDSEIGKMNLSAD